MYVCICNEVTERQIHKAVADGATDLEHLQDRLGVSTGCGTCAQFAVECLQEALRERSPREPLSRPA